MKKIFSKTFFPVLFLIVFSKITFSQDHSVDESIKKGISQAYISYISYDKNLLMEAKETFEKALSQDNSNTFALYHITYCEYKLLEMSLRKENEGLFDKYYDAAVANAEKLSETKGIGSEGKTLLAGIYMMKIANSPMSAVTLSFKIHSLLNEAEEINKINPRTYLIRGTMKFQTPAMFGGSFEDAVKSFTRAVSLFEKQDSINALEPNWGYLEVLAWLGKAHEKLENYDAAKFAYQKALAVEPNFGWVKSSLLPKLEEKMKGKN